MRQIFLVVLVAGALCADSLDSILQRMNESSKNFKAVTAKLHEVSYNAVLQDSNTQEGELRLRRQKKGVVTGVLHFLPPDEHSVGFNGSTIQTYYPKANQVDEFHIGKNAAQLDQFILLAFGAAGTDLQQTYDIKLGGQETINGTPATRLDLTPKSPEARKYATLIQLWIPEGKSNAIQERIEEPSKNYVLNTYSDVDLNPKLPDSDFELKLPKNVQRIRTK